MNIFYNQYLIFYKYVFFRPTWVSENLRYGLTMECLIKSTDMRLVIISIFALLLTSSCYYDNEENLFPTLSNECDTSSMSYSLDVQPLLSINCYDCHSNLNSPALGNNINLEDLSNVRALADQILSSINHESGVSPMPKGSYKLHKCDLLIFEAWISKGKLEN